MPKYNNLYFSKPPPKRQAFSMAGVKQTFLLYFKETLFLSWDKILRRAVSSF